MFLPSTVYFCMVRWKRCHLIHVFVDISILMINCSHIFPVTGNLISCDCHVTYLHTWLRHVTSVTNSSVTNSSAVCATPPELDNAPVIMLTTIPSCDTSTDTSDYYYTYEYYHDNATETSLESFLLSTREVHYQRHVYSPRDRVMVLTFGMDPDTNPYQCDLINVFKETSDGPLMKTAVPCDNNSVDTDTMTVNNFGQKKMHR